MLPWDRSGYPIDPCRLDQYQEDCHQVWKCLRDDLRMMFRMARIWLNGKGEKIHIHRAKNFLRSMFMQSMVESPSLRACTYVEKHSTPDMPTFGTPEESQTSLSPASMIVGALKG